MQQEEGLVQCNGWHYVQLHRVCHTGKGQSCVLPCAHANITQVAWAQHVHLPCLQSVCAGVHRVTPCEGGDQPVCVCIHLTALQGCIHVYIQVGLLWFVRPTSDSVSWFG
jgi:hypothetical protein